MTIYSSLPEFRKNLAEIKLLLDWHRGFSLFFVLSQNTLSSTALRERLQDYYLKLTTHQINWINPDSPVDINQQLATRLFGQPGPPVWLELGRQDSQGEWDRARQQALGLLNRRRSKLEEEINGPLFIQLPGDFAAQIVTWAPDLWSIRQQVIELPAVWQISTMHSLLDLPDTPDNQSPSQEKIHSLRLKVETLKARQTASNEKPYRIRELAIALLELGEALIEVQDLRQARQYTSESLALFRDLRATLGDSPQALRDLSVSLDNLGKMEQLGGRLDAARAAYAESLALRRDLRAALGDSPQALRDLSIALNNLGKMEQLGGRLDAARAAYTESLALCRELRAALGDSPQALRDLSIALNKLSDVEQLSGCLDAARAAYTESLALCHEPACGLGGQPPGVARLVDCAG